MAIKRQQKAPKSAPQDPELRQSQLLTTYGPGAMVDLPDHSVLISGLDFWRMPTGISIDEERLQQRVCERLGLTSVTLRPPPAQSDGEGASEDAYIPAFVFPNWFVAQVELQWTGPGGRVYRTRPLIPGSQLIRNKWVDDDRKPHPVVPVRFVQACERGHISDINWYAFVRNDFDTDRTGRLWLDEGGAGSDFSEIFIRCERTGKRRPLSDARIPDKAFLGRCGGQQLWLGEPSRERCNRNNRLLTRSASNAWFSQQISVISIPERDARLRQVVGEQFESLKKVSSLEMLRMLCSMLDVLQERLAGFDEAEVLAEIKRRQAGSLEPPKSIKRVELESLLAAEAGHIDEAPQGDFYARARSLAALPKQLDGLLERVVLVHRLREVTAQIGFTRFEPSITNIDGELVDRERQGEGDLGVELAPLSRDQPTWVPALENRGEGVFLAFSRSAVEAWAARPGVQRRAAQLASGFEQWRRRNGMEDSRMPFPGAAFVMLHSLSHLLITTVALDCGYSASSIRERIYADPEVGYGILLYTGSPGAEGTLGGLVEVGRRIERYLLQALEAGRLCSNDPVCAQHAPQDAHEERFLHGAACHGCLLIAETSCERRNDFLDRALVVPTVEEPDAAFFPEELA